MERQSNDPETDALFARWRSGDARARDGLVELYTPLAHHLARRYHNTSEPDEDLRQVAQFMELSTEDVLEAIQAMHGYGSLSLDVPRGSEPGDEDGSYADTLGEEDPRYELVELPACVTPAFARLEPRQRSSIPSISAF